MLRRDLLRALMATPLARRLRPWIPSEFFVVATEGPNAADLYRKAFGWAKGLGSEDRERLRKAATVAIDDQCVSALIEQARPVLEALRAAAAIDECRWGVEPVTGHDLVKGHFNVFNVDIVRVACLSTRRHAESGRDRDALDDAFAGLTLAHRIGAGGLQIARLLECGGEVPVFRTLARILPGLKRASLDDLSRRLVALAPPEPASAMIGPESRFILDSLHSSWWRLDRSVEDEEWAELGLNEDEAAVLQRLTEGDRGKLLAHLDATVPAFAELARRLDLPRPGCRGALDEFAKAEEATHPIVAGLVEPAWGARQMVDRMLAMRSMLRAGIALVRDGEPDFRAEPDPFGTGPFGLERRGKGFLIRSALNDGGKPEVSLEIGDVA